MLVERLSWHTVLPRMRPAHTPRPHSLPVAALFLRINGDRITLPAANKQGAVRPSAAVGTFGDVV